MNDDIAKKREKEQALVRWMIGSYCRGNHGTRRGGLCAPCEALAAYAHGRTACCPRMAEKNFCSGCPHPCYGAEQRQAIKRVMRHAGSRLLLHAPAAALRHLAITIRQRRNADGHPV